MLFVGGPCVTPIRHYFHSMQFEVPLDVVSQQLMRTFTVLLCTMQSCLFVCNSCSEQLIRTAFQNSFSEQLIGCSWSVAAVVMNQAVIQADSWWFTILNIRFTLYDRLLRIAKFTVLASLTTLKLKKLP